MDALGELGTIRGLIWCGERRCLRSFSKGSPAAMSWEPHMGVAGRGRRPKRTISWRLAGRAEG
jgi:hypothetical protein